MPQIDKFIYLDCSIQTILEHMRKRWREYEDNLDLMYVYELKSLYDCGAGRCLRIGRSPSIWTAGNTTFPKL